MSTDETTISEAWTGFEFGMKFANHDSAKLDATNLMPAWPPPVFSLLAEVPVRRLDDIDIFQKSKCFIYLIALYPQLGKAKKIQHAMVIW